MASGTGVDHLRVVRGVAVLDPAAPPWTSTGMSPASVMRTERAVLVVVVGDGVVLGGAVVPDRQIARLPVPADGVLQLGDPRLQQVEQRRDSVALRPTNRLTKWPSSSTRLPVSGCTRTTGCSVS